MKTQILLFISTFLFCNLAFGTTIYVTNVSNSGNGSIRKALSSASSNDVVQFHPSLITNGSDTIKLNAQINLTRNVTIRGLYNSTDTIYIMGKPNFRIFHITNCSHITLDSLIIIDGEANGEGGAIYCTYTDSLTIKNSIIRNCSVTKIGNYGKGGAIFSTVHLTIYNSSITNNSLT